MLALRSPSLTAAGFLVAIAYGITFPLISSRLEATGVGGQWIGVNAAMPALGWIAGSLVVPQLQVRLGMPIRRVLQLFLAVAILALAALRFADGYAAMTLLRLFFGGAMGVVFRCLEYWINSVSMAQERGRNVGVYSILFMVGLIVGSVLQPGIGSDGWGAFAPPLGLLSAGLLLLQAWSGRPDAVIESALPPAVLPVARAIPIALLAVLVYGAYECVPTTMLQIYAVRNDIDSTMAAYALPSAAAGNLVLQYPVAALSDRIGRSVPLFLCLATAAAAAAALPVALAEPAAFLAACAVMGGTAGAAYSMALAMVGDHFDGARLVVANAVFGIVYALGSLGGPLLNGFAIAQSRNYGLAAFLATTFGGLAAIVAAAWCTARQRRSVP